MHASIWGCDHVLMLARLDAIGQREATIPCCAIETPQSDCSEYRHSPLSRVFVTGSFPQLTTQFGTHFPISMGTYNSVEPREQ
jgi:hypothetical protein